MMEAELIKSLVKKIEEEYNDMNKAEKIYFRFRTNIENQLLTKGYAKIDYDDFLDMIKEVMKE